uniref:Uncharacterized protein n=1 Tax=Fagus sylvatica TaxID=28930 RepID=A0A2N9EQS5_FAGSY
MKIKKYEENKGDIVVQKDVTLPQIDKISLEGLPSLVNFCPRNYHAILPKLYHLKVQRCPNMTMKFTRAPDKSVHINGEVPQVDEEDEPTGFSTNSSVEEEVTFRRSDEDDGSEDEDGSEDKEEDEEEEDDHVADNDDSESDDADYNLLESCDDDDDQPKE